MDGRATWPAAVDRMPCPATQVTTAQAPPSGCSMVPWMRCSRRVKYGQAMRSRSSHPGASSARHGSGVCGPWSVREKSMVASDSVTCSGRGWPSSPNLSQS